MRLAAQAAEKADAQARFVLRRQERAQKRYLAAVKALAVQRKLRPQPSTSGARPDERDPVLSLGRQAWAGRVAGIRLPTPRDESE